MPAARLLGTIIDGIDVLGDEMRIALRAGGQAELADVVAGRLDRNLDWAYERLGPSRSSAVFFVVSGGDGRGFEPASADGSAGLQNMADRIGALGGGLRVDSRPGEGTRVAGSVPVGV